VINAKVVVIEFLALAVTGRATYRMMLSDGSGIPRSVIAEGHSKLRPGYRRKVNRTVGGWLRRFRVAGEEWARSIARRSVLA
jgi:hypothetical protein